MCPEWRTIVYEVLRCIEKYSLSTQRGAPMKPYEDYITAFHVGPQCWSHMAADLDVWRHSIFKVVSVFEDDGRSPAKVQIDPSQTRRRILLSPVDTAHRPDFPALRTSFLSVTADNMDIFIIACRQ